MWIDQFIGYFSPQAGRDRTLARMQLQQLLRHSRAYEGAKTGRRTDGWNTTGTSANAEALPAISKLRDRARDMVRNNQYASKAVDEYANYIIGNGITPRFQVASARNRKKISDAFTAWSDTCDADGLEDFYGLQALVARTEFEAGEVLIRYRQRLSSDGLLIPMQLQVLEPDYLDSNKFEMLNNGGRIMQGIEFDAIGRRVAYWLFSEHPGDNMRFRAFTSSRVPAEEVLHIFRRRRPGQARGITAFAPVLLKMRDLDEYDDAELFRKKMESCIVAFITQMESANKKPLTDSETDPETGQRIEKFKAGTYTYLKPGENVEFNTPGSSAGFKEYMDTQLHAVAAGLSQTYEQLTGDLSGVNYSSMRGGQLIQKRHVERIQNQLYIARFCRPVVSRVLTMAGIAGVVNSAGITAKWSAPKFEMVDPFKDTKATIMKVRAGLITWQEAVAEMGFDPQEQLADIVSANADFDANKVILDIDPRKVQNNGQQQNDTSNTEDNSNAQN